MDQPNHPLPPGALGATSTTAIISLVGGIAGLTILPIIGAFVALICGYIAKNEIKKSAGTLGGNGMATAGIIMGYLSIALGICLCIVLIMPGLISGIATNFGN